MRKIKIIRKKRFIACTAPLYLIVDGNIIKNMPIKNGHISEHIIDEQKHTFQIEAEFDEGKEYSNICCVPMNAKNYELRIEIKMGLIHGYVFLYCNTY